MMMPRPRQNTVALTGWLFADLLLGMAMFFLVANSSGTRQPPATPTITPTATVTPRPTPTLFPTPFPTSTPFTSLSPDPITPTIKTVPGALLAIGSGQSSQIVQQERTRLIAELKKLFGDRCQTASIGMVLVFGTAPEPSRGKQYADAFVKVLQDEEFKSLCGEPVLKPYHQIDPSLANLGDIYLEVFFFNHK